MPEGNEGISETPRRRRRRAEQPIAVDAESPEVLVTGDGVKLSQNTKAEVRKAKRAKEKSDNVAVKSSVDILTNTNDGVTSYKVVLIRVVRDGRTKNKLMAHTKSKTTAELRKKTAEKKFKV